MWMTTTSGDINEIRDGIFGEKLDLLTSWSTKRLKGNRFQVGLLKEEHRAVQGMVAKSFAQKEKLTIMRLFLL